MDRRKINAHRGLHKNLQPLFDDPDDDGPPDSEDIFASSYQSDRLSQRVSNTELLRKQAHTSSSATSDDKNNQNNDKLSQLPVAHTSSHVSQTRPIASQSKIRKQIIPESLSSSQSTQCSDVSVKRRKVDEPPRNILREKQRSCRAPPGNAVRNTIQLTDFFKQCGITLDENEMRYLIANDSLIIAKKMQQLLTSGDFQKQVITEQWNNYIQDDDQLNKLLSSTIMNNGDGRQIGSFNSISVVKIMLQVSCIQTEILGSLMNKLNETVVIADSMDNVPWAYQLLQQLRFLETINDPEVLTLKLEELLETCPIWFLLELIAFIPDIVIDTQHHNIAEILVRLMEAHKDLTNVILTCITNLSLGKESLEELREKMLKILQEYCHISKVSAIIKFCLNDCPSADVCQNVLRVIRALDLQPLSEEDVEEYYTSQTLIMNTLKTILVLSKDMTKAAIMIVESTDSNAKPLDLIILLLLHDGMTKRKKANAILKQHIKTGFYRVSLLNEFYTDYKEIAKELQLIALNMSSNLLKSEDRVLTDFTTEWFRLQFSIHGDLIHKQREIVEKLIALMGYNDQTAKNSLLILCKMTEKSEEKRFLQAHCNYLRILLEKIEKLDLKDVTMLNDLLQALSATSNSVSETLRDDLTILLQKQLSCNDSIMKSKGVAGAVMAIKHLTTKEKFCHEALKIFDKVSNSVKNCSRSRGFFYDTLGEIIANTDDINENFLQKITNIIEDEFINTYMIKPNEYTGDLTPCFGLNNTGDDDSQNCIVNFGTCNYGSIISALLRLMKICNMKLNTAGDLENINALLGSEILMPKDMDLPDTQTMDLMFNCVNWLRELINTFVTEKKPLLQYQVLKRLENTMQLQGELSNVLSIAETRYQPPVCYFHSFSVVPLNKVEKKTKKGKKTKDTDVSHDRSISVPEWESWERGALLSTKNPMYFRRLDANILDLLDTSDIEFRGSQVLKISTGQICFIIKELLAVFNEESGNDDFMKNLIRKLPKICAKLHDIVIKLKEDENNQYKYALRLILSLITTIFQWKGFSNPTNNVLLRDALRVIASQIDESNAGLRSCKDLVGESFRYFESLADAATQIQLASALVETCAVIMKHSETFTRQNKDKQACMAYGFLSLEWPSDLHTGPEYKVAVPSLLRNWMNHTSSPLDTVSSVLEWLPEDVKRLERPQDCLTRLPPINKLNFHNFYAKLFDGLITGIRISLKSAKTDTMKIQMWRDVAKNLQRLVDICKTLVRKTMLLVYVRSMPGLLRLFLTHAMPVLEHNLRHQPEEITGILKLMQGGTRYLNIICVDSTEKKDITLTKYVPAAKSILEQLLYSVKGMFVVNNSSTAFWMGNLLNKNLEGHEICSQTSNTTDESMVPDVDNSNDTSNISGDDILSDVLDNDNDNDSFDDNDDIITDES